MSIKGQGYFLTLGKVVYIQKFKPNFLRNYFADLNQIFYESFPGFVCFVFTRPRYQVSVYRTTGPLVNSALGSSSGAIAVSSLSAIPNNIL